MISIHNIPIKYKLVIMQVLTSFIVLSICCVFFVVTDIKSYKERKAESINAIAQVLGSNSISALQFMDNATASAKLSELNVETDILNAAIVDKSGMVFASYTKKGAKIFNFPLNRFNTDRIEFTDPYLFVYHKIMNNQEIQGTVCLQVGLTQLEKITHEKIQIAGILLLIGIILALLISIIFQGSISSPIFDLVFTMQKVKRSGDYKSRAQVKGTDEVNTLSLVFNDMLERIEKREVHIKQRTVELEIANTRFQNLIESAPDAIVTIDENGVITNWNPKAETMFGWSETEAIGQTLSHTIIPEEYREAHENGLAGFLKTGTGTVLNRSIELSALRKDQTQFPIELNISSSTVNGKHVFIGFIRDIVERKKAEEKILALNKELAQKLNELEISNKEMESFSYSVSHDLRAPIRAINGFSKIIEKQYSSLFDEEGKSLLQTISGEAKRMGQLIDDLLAFSRLGKKEIQKTKVDMTTLAKEVVTEIEKFSVETNKAKILVDHLPSAYCDRSLMRQVFVNLISNSVKYSGQIPSPAIRIGSFMQNSAVVYFIKDNGAGFDMKFYDKLFGVFQRLHSSEDFAGTGIGLAIVKRIIIRHGGKVWGEGKVNSGATFYFSLPL